MNTEQSDCLEKFLAGGDSVFLFYTLMQLLLINEKNTYKIHKNN